MHIVCRCDACGGQFKLDGAKYGGKKIKCPKCEAPIVVPMPEAEPAEAEGELPAGDARWAEPASAILPPAKGPAKSAPPVRDSAAALPEAPAAAAGPASPLAGLNVAVAGGAKSSAASVARAPKKNNNTTLVVAGGALALVVLVGVVAGVMLSSGGGKDGGKKVAGGDSKGSATALLLNWPENERDGAKLLINKKSQSFPAKGPISITLAPGNHDVVIQRRGYEQYQQTVVLKKGEPMVLVPNWRKSEASVASNPFSADGKAQGGPNNGQPPQAFAPASYGDWEQDYEAACKKAAAEKKDVLVAFMQSGAEESDTLAEQVFFNGGFRHLVDPKFVLVLIDTPAPGESKRHVQSEKRNAELQKKMFVREFPTLLLADEQGAPYSVESEAEYLEGPADQFGNRLLNWQSNRKERDRLLKAVESGMGPARLQAARNAVDWLNSHNVLLHHAEHLKKWVALATELDPKNEQGDLEGFFLGEWLVRVATGEFDEGEKAKTAVQELVDWIQAHPLKKPESSIEVLVRCAMWLAFKGHQKAAEDCIDAGMNTANVDERTKQRLAMMRRGLAQLSRQVLSSGTGYVIDERGYLLTNHHVIDGTGRTFVRLGGTEVPATVVVFNKDLDMAIVKIEPPMGTALKPLVIENVVARRGSAVAAFGYPLGDVTGTDIKLTTGVVSALPDPKNEGMYILDCRVNPGNSGGPLCDKQGRVVGMVTAKTFSSGTVESYGMARPAADLVAFVNKNVPEFKSPEHKPSERPLEWDEVDQVVSPSVLMIVKKI